MTLFKAALVHAPNSAFHQQRVDLRVSKAGILTDIGPELVPKDKETVVIAENLNVSPGWLDIGAYLGDPGHEDREDVDSLAASAVAGGYTAVAPLPNTEPTVSSKSAINYLLRRSGGLAVKFHPIGTVSDHGKGNDIAEILDMSAAGAVAFYDGYHHLQSAGLLMRALQYAQTNDALICDFPLDKTLSKGRQIHEGKISTLLGMPGIPTLAEELAIQRDLSILEYTGGRLHLMNITSAAGLALIRQAKKQKLNVTCSVSYLHLIADETNVMDFSVHHKVHAPLRKASDRKALVRGVLDGTIDCITSNHYSRTIDETMVEFPYAALGSVGLETAFSATKTVLAAQFSTDWWVQKVAIAPRTLLKIEVPRLAVGEPAELTFWDDAATWTLAKADLKSKGKNSPFIGSSFVGRIKATVSNGKVYLATNQ